MKCTPFPLENIVQAQEGWDRAWSRGNATPKHWCHVRLFRYYFRCQPQSPGTSSSLSFEALSYAATSNLLIVFAWNLLVVIAKSLLVIVGNLFIYSNLLIVVGNILIFINLLITGSNFVYRNLLVVAGNKKNMGIGYWSPIHRRTVVLYLSYCPATKFFNQNSRMSGVLITV